MSFDLQPNTSFHSRPARSIYGADGPATHYLCDWLSTARTKEDPDFLDRVPFGAFMELSDQPSKNRLVRNRSCCPSLRLVHRTVRVPRTQSFSQAGDLGSAAPLTSTCMQLHPFVHRLHPTSQKQPNEICETPHSTPEIRLEHTKPFNRLERGDALRGRGSPRSGKSPDERDPAGVMCARVGSAAPTEKVNPDFICLQGACAGFLPPRGFLLFSLFREVQVV